MVLGMLLVLAQQAAPAQAQTVARVEVTPAAAEIEVGGTVQLQARALDSAGRVVPGAQVQWFTGGGEGSVDQTTGLVRGGYPGTVQVTAVAGTPGANPAVGTVRIKVLPQPAARVDVSPQPARLVAGSRIALRGTAYSAQDDEREDPVVFASSNPAVLRTTEDGRIEAVAAGRAVITAKAGSATAQVPIEVLPNTVARLEITPERSSVRTGDVVPFTARALDRNGRPVADVAVQWAIAATGEMGVAQIDPQGRFVAENAGQYTVTASVGGRSADAVVDAEPRRVGRALEVVGRLPIEMRAAEVWAHPGGQCVYLSTIADRVYAVDVTAPGQPRIVDSMVTNARLVNDVMTTEDGRYGVFSREGASDRRNGIVIFDASDACHPRPIAEYTETVSGGVHSTYVYDGHVYLTDDATGSIRVIDIREPRSPKEVARWQTENEAGRYVHDIMVVDGLAYLSYWNDGLIILDVGNGMKGGSPTSPQFVSRLKYDLDETYRRVDMMYGLGPRGTHTAWRHGNYVFVGDEVYAARPATGLESGNDLTFGRLHVIDVADIENPKEVAWYEPTDGGVHNVWVVGDTLYMGAYQGGARVLDISGELKGDLLTQGREISWLATADSVGARPRATFAWGAVVKDGNIYIPDINTGLWILKLEGKRDEPVP